MKLNRLIAEIKTSKIYNFKNLEIEGISTDSRNSHSGEIFIALKGHSSDGHRFIKEALDRGVVCILVDKDESLELSKVFEKITIVVVDDTLQAFISLAGVFYKDKIKGLKLIAVTGTNGKTTVTYLIENILKSAGFKTGIIGTIGYSFPGHREASHNTTPGLNDLYKLFVQMRAKGVDFCVMETSSHALEQGRVGGLDFYRAIFTNISRDHLDYHKNFKNYFDAKSKLFRMLKKGYSKAVINRDDSFGRKLLKISAVDKLTYGLRQDAKVRARDIKLSEKETNFFISHKNEEIVINTKLLGLYNVYNILAATACALSMNLEPKIITQGIRRLKKVPGRLELIGSKGKTKIYIDYAHTPGALRALLEFFSALRKKQGKRRIVLVFGCGGERDKVKRPQMGNIACRFADLVVLTNDNPRSEDPKGIIYDIIKGMRKDCNYIVIEDRLQAIRKAINEARNNDIVLIAGKGHERQQIFKDRIEEYSDSLAVKKALRI